MCPMAFVISTCSAACACSDADEGLGISSATEEVLKIADLMAQMASPRTTCFCARIPMAFHRTEGESIAQRDSPVNSPPPCSPVLPRGFLGPSLRN